MSRAGKILVTGAGGFVGSALCARLLNTAEPLAVLTRQWLPLPAGVIQHQIADVAAIPLQNHCFDGVEVIVHLAALAHQDTAFGNSKTRASASDYSKINLVATRRLAEAAVGRGVKRLVFLSTVKVNGEATVPPRLFTAADQVAPEGAYAISKWQAELALWEVAAKTGLEVVVIRSPLVYGPGARANFAALLTLVSSGVPLPLAAVRNQRSLIAVDNLADLIALCCRHPQAAGETFMASDGDDLSAPQLVRLLASSAGKPSRLFALPPKVLELCCAVLGRAAAWQKLCGSLQVDSATAREKLNWTPPLTTEQAFQAYGGQW